MAKKVAKRKTADPLQGVRIEPPRTAGEAVADAGRVLADAAISAAEVDETSPSIVEIAATAARVKIEKQLVSAPAKISAKKLPRYRVMNDQTVSWRGQQLRLKGGKSEVGDEKQGPGAVAKFQSMGVKLQEIK